MSNTKIWNSHLTYCIKQLRSTVEIFKHSGLLFDPGWLGGQHRLVTRLTWVNQS